MIIIFIVLCVLLLLLITFNSSYFYKYDRYEEESNPKPNINKKIQEAKLENQKKVAQYNLGSKSYKYDFIENEQPINGLSQNYDQDYPSTLKKSNKMFVTPDLSSDYINLLNTRNNSIKNYNNS